VSEDVTPIPTPGSTDALAQGCVCPVLDNAHGKGAYIDPVDGPQFWIVFTCPLHGAAARAKQVQP
jgi:hypothetical protein